MNVGAGLIWTARRSACGHSAGLNVDTSPEFLWTVAAWPAQLSNREIQTLGVASKSGVSNFTAAFEKSGLNIHQALAMDDSSLSVALFPEVGAYIKPKLSFKPVPDWNTIHNELKKKGVTRQLLWEEYREKHPNGYGYSQFNEHYRRFTLTLNPFDAAGPFRRR